MKYVSNTGSAGWACSCVTLFLVKRLYLLLGMVTPPLLGGSELSEESKQELTDYVRSAIKERYSITCQMPLFG